MSCNSLAKDITDAVKTTTVETSDILALVRSSTLYGVTFSNFQTALGVTGQIKPIGSPTAVQILNQPSSNMNYIRSIDPSQGITATVDPYGGISLKTNLANAGTGVDGAQSIVDQTADQILFKRIKAGTGMSVAETTNSITLNSTVEVSLQNQIIVRTSADLLGTLDSTKSYFIDGLIDMTGVSVVVPDSGLTLDGYGFGVSGLFCADNSYSMFTDTFGCGNVFISKVDLSVTGTSSKIYDLEGSTGQEAFETNYVNYNNCTSLGELNGFRQGLEFNTGRFGGSPSLTLAGTWDGGYRVAVSIASVADTMTDPLFKAGAGFLVNTRVLISINADLGSTAGLLDFAPANFITSGALELNDCVVQRNGVFDASDATISPNIDETNLECLWFRNKGLRNTHTGGRLDISASALTTIVTIDTYVNLAGTYLASEIVHFDSPSNGQLRHLADEPLDYRIDADIPVIGTGNDMLKVAVVKYRAATASNVIVQEQERRVNSVSGPNDTAFFNIATTTEMDVDDYIFFQIKNTTNTNNCTAQVDTHLLVGER